MPQSRVGRIFISFKQFLCIYVKNCFKYATLICGDMKNTSVKKRVFFCDFHVSRVVTGIMTRTEL